MSAFGAISASPAQGFFSKVCQTEFAKLAENAQCAEAS
jgi:hypothetical protein